LNKHNNDDDEDDDSEEAFSLGDKEDEHEVRPFPLLVRSNFCGFFSSKYPFSKALPSLANFRLFPMIIPKFRNSSLSERLVV
jgi:hypothetical protein